MSTHIDALRVRAVMGRDEWGIPEPHGPDGWSLIHRSRTGSIIVSCASHPDDAADYVHASIAWADHDPSYRDLTRLHRAVWGSTGWAVQVFAPAADHVNIHDHALHLWGRLDGQRMHPDFGWAGTI